MKYLDLKLGYKCNNECLHCVIADQREKALNLRGNTNRSTQECIDEILKSKQQGCDSITITGGEPTIRKDFLEIIEFAKKEDFRVLLQSNGRAFHYNKFAKEASRFISGFLIALHSHKEIVHDQVTRRKGSFKETIQGLKNLLLYTDMIGVKIVLSKYNYKDLVDIVIFVKSLGIKHIKISSPQPDGNAYKYFDKIVPRYSMMKECIEQTLEYAISKEYDLTLGTIMPCSLDKVFPLKYFSNIRLSAGNNLEVKQLDHTFENWSLVKNKLHKKGNICSRCIYNNFCEGYWKEYIDKFGFEEFHPITQVPEEIKKTLVSNIKSWK